MCERNFILITKTDEGSLMKISKTLLMLSSVSAVTPIQAVDRDWDNKWHWSTETDTSDKHDTRIRLSLWDPHFQCCCL